jgi:hypothetical protein
MLEGHEGANPHVGQRVAKLTHLDLFKLLENSAHLRGPKSRPLDIPENERTTIVLNAIYPKGIPDYVHRDFDILKKNTTRFICKCEKLYKASARNHKRFIAKNKKWLSSKFNLYSSKETDQLIHSNRQENRNFKEEPTTSSVQIVPSSAVEIISPLDRNVEEEPTTSSAHIIPSTSEENIRLLEVPSSSNSNQYLSDRSHWRIRKPLELELEKYPTDLLVTVTAKLLVDETGNKLSKSSAKDLEFVVKECLKSPTQSTELANLIRSNQGKNA